MENTFLKGETDIQSFVDLPFNINSPKQLTHVLFDILKLPVIKKTKTGYSSDNEVLEKLRKEHDIIDFIIDYRHFTKLKNTYIDPLPQMVDADHILHTCYLQDGTATGRLSSEKPNLQNIPLKSVEGRIIREAFCPRENHVFISLDYSQIELRVLAHLSSDEKMCEAFLKNRDIHTETAMSLFQCEREDVDEEKRRFAKAINFGLIYGKTAYGLSQDLECSQKEAKSFIETYFSAFPKVQSFIDQTISSSFERGYTETLWGRRRFCPQNVPARQQGAIQRMAVNTCIQGTAAELMKASMLKVDKMLEQNEVQASILLQIHDEILVESRKEDADTVAAICQKEMESVTPFSCPLKVNVSTGGHWGAVH